VIAGYLLAGKETDMTPLHCMTKYAVETEAPTSMVKTEANDKLEALLTSAALLAGEIAEL
jgi:hypothetical protein